MFERYTEKARRAIFFARYEASRFGSPSIESEHLLLGLIRELKSGLDLFLPDLTMRAAIPSRIEGHTVLREKISTSVDLPLSNECKRALAYAGEEADLLGHRHIGSEHLLLGLLREEGCFGAQVMRECGADLARARKALAEGGPRPESRAQREPGEEQSDIAYTEETIGHFIVQKLSDLASEQPEFKKYTERARLAVLFSKYEARNEGLSAAETVHLLRGLLRLPSGDQYRFLPQTLAWASVSTRLKSHHSASQIAGSVVANLPFDDECKQALAFADEEAARLGHDKTAVEHLLLGLLRVEDSAASKIMRENGADLDHLRQKLAAAAPPQTGAQS
jgi:ATP-dependent Clp protease ATP-binding subunit ClpA